MTAGTSLFGGQIGQIFGIQNDKRQLAMNQQLLNQQIAANEQMSNYSQGLQKDMWDYTNYENQVKHLEAAGLNPALLYGKGGGGGATVGAGGMEVGTQGGPKGGMENIAVAGMALQNQATAASIELMKANANKANADADATRGYLKDATGARMQLDLANIQNVQAQTKLIELNQKAVDLANQLAEGTLESNISAASAYAQKVTAEMHIMNSQQWLTENSMKTQLAQIQQNFANSVLQGELMKAQTREAASNIALNSSKIKQIAQEIINSKEFVRIADYNARTGNMNAVSNQQNADTQKDWIELQKQLHDISDREKIDYNLLNNAVQIMTFGAGKLFK